MGDGLVSMVNKTLSRSASQPAIFPHKLLEKQLKQLVKGGRGLFSGDGGQKVAEDDLDIIKQIIDTDVSLTSVNSGEEGLPSGGSLKSQSLTHLPGQFPNFAGSLPSLHRGESMHVIHANYNSEPDFTRRMSAYDTQIPIGHRGGGASSAEQATTYGHGEFQMIPTDSSGYMGQDDLMNLQDGIRKSMDGQSLSRRNSLYEGQSTAGTPSLPSNSMQNTPLSAGGTPFDFAHPRNVQLSDYVAGGGAMADRSGVVVKSEGLSTTSLNAGGYGVSGAADRWNQQSMNTPGMPDACQYMATGANDGMDALPHLSETGLSQEGGGRRGSGVNNPSAGLLYDYLVGGGGGGGGQEETCKERKSATKREGAKSKSCALSSTLKRKLQTLFVTWHRERPVTA